MLTEETELFIRTSLTEKAATAENVSFSALEPNYFSGKEDFAAQTGVTNKTNTKEQNAVALKNLLCNFVMTFYGRFDSTKKGSVLCPVMLVTYDILVFQEFRFGLEAESNAHNAHVATVMQILKEFTKNRVLRADPLIRHKDLIQVGKTVRGQATEFLPKVKGFYTNLSCQVEVS